MKELSFYQINEVTRPLFIQIDPGHVKIYMWLAGSRDMYSSSKLINALLDGLVHAFKAQPITKSIHFYVTAGREVHHICGERERERERGESQAQDTIQLPHTKG